jgi:hypothetical protein
MVKEQRKLLRFYRTIYEAETNFDSDEQASNFRRGPSAQEKLSQCIIFRNAEC